MNLTIWLSLFSGLIQLLLGVLRLGVVATLATVHYMQWGVLTGFVL